MQYSIELAQIASGGVKRKLLTIKVEESSNIIKRTWGLEGHKMQDSTKKVVGKNIGRANETTPNEQAVLDATAIATKKITQGYRDVDDTEAQAESEVFSFDPIPESFAPSKPINDPPKGVTFSSGYEKYFSERKNDGANLWKVTRLDGGEDFYTRGAKRITDIVKGVLPLETFLSDSVEPPGSLVSVEFICYDKNGRECAKDLRGIVNDRTSNEKALARYDLLTSKGYTFAIKAFDVLFWNSKNVCDKEYFERRELLHSLWEDHPGYRSVAFTTLTPEIIQKAHDQGWEGFILRNLTGDDSKVKVTMNGKPKRAGAWKFKFQHTDDYVVTHIQVGNGGRLKGKLAQFKLAKYDDSANLVDICWAGPGTLTTEELDALAEELFPGKDLTTWEPKVPVEVDHFCVEVKFSKKQPETNALEHPVLMATRPDKPLKECLLSDVPEMYNK